MKFEQAVSTDQKWFYNRAGRCTEMRAFSGLHWKTHVFDSACEIAKNAIVLNKGGYCHHVLSPNWGVPSTVRGPSADVHLGGHSRHFEREVGMTASPQ